MSIVNSHAYPKSGGLVKGTMSEEVTGPEEAINSSAHAGHLSICDNDKKLTLLSYLSQREHGEIKCRKRLLHSIEESYWSRSLPIPKDIPFPQEDNVLSTIAIAASPDGYTFATTHGDHTVKIFKCNSSTPYRVFVGHPRTPWTVKYNPTNPDIVASGCLGQEVRIWDISRNTCVNMIRLDASIISLSFHPTGDLIAICSGAKLHTWDWREGMAEAWGGCMIGQSKYPSRRVVVHPRNIRAVMFHPNGDFIFAAAPDPPRIPSSAFTPCR